MRTIATALCLALAGCSTAVSTVSSQDASSDATVDAAPSDTGAADAPIADAGAVDAPAFNYNDCTNFDFDSNDRTAPDASRVIVFSFRAAAQQYNPRCMKVKAQQSVRWEGSFSDHPLVVAGGDVPNPIANATVDASTAVIAFPNAGWYGFECKTHESPAEYGVVLVVP